MINIGGTMYYINFEALDELISTDDSLKAQEIKETENKESYDDKGNLISSVLTTKTYLKSKEIDGARYDCVGLMLQIIMNSDVELDGTLGFERALKSQPLNWQIAYNTLIHNGILIAEEEE